MRIAWCFVLVACSSTPDDDFPAPSADEGLQLNYYATAAPGEELWKCKVLDLDTDDWLNIHRVESIQNDSMHHMDLMAVALSTPELGPGDYDCGPLYDMYPSLMDEGVNIYASQQPSQVVQLP